MEPTPRLEVLAVELETFGREDLDPIIAHVRDDSYPRYKLVEELRNIKFSYFAQKLKIGYYDVFKR